MSASELETHKGNVSVRTKIDIATYEHRRAARQKIRTALTGIEESIRSAYLAHHSARTDNHPHDLENNVLRDDWALKEDARAIRLLRDFRTLVMDIEGDLGDGSAAVMEACLVASSKLTAYLAHSSDMFIMAEETESDRMAGDALRRILAAEDKMDAACLQ